MDADRVIKVLEILAWPCTAIFFGLLFRSQVAGLIRRINAVEAGGVKAAFSAELLEIRDSQELAEEPHPPKSFDSKASRLQTLAELSPNGAVVDAWREVELATISAALTAGVTVKGNKGRVSGSAAIKGLQTEGILSESTNDLFDKLRALRNKAAHSSETIEPSDAKEYVLAALELAEKFRELSLQPTSTSE
ncbi:DUF4145 domain-containing protein [Pseudomonas sp. TWRC1-2]|uniref:DUF4145 domain-containing protein n=1 Tax=Pseudomonas sp. TWRC1-2 TaxID=2804628 RepID=UPI003CF5B89C